MGTCANTYFLERNQSELLLADRLDHIVRYNTEREVDELMRQCRTFDGAKSVIRDYGLDPIAELERIGTLYSDDAYHEHILALALKDMKYPLPVIYSIAARLAAGRFPQ